MAAKLHRSRTVRAVYMSLGLVSLALGMVGIFLPLIPTTGPIILAGFFFARSSDRFNQWLLAHPRFGPMLRDYQAGLGIPMRAKVLAVAMIAVTFSISIVFVVGTMPWRLALVALAVAIATFIVTRPTRRADASVAVDAPLAG